ncbi:MAG: Crp/Fnr family transcriptional regulator [Cyclobacteriaceae bacterium]
MDEIRKYFNNFLVLSDAEWLDFESCLMQQDIAKKETLINEGQVCDFIAFIAQGTFRFYVVKEGEEKVTAFFFKGSFVTNFRSFLTEQPSEHFIEALQDSVVYKMPKKDLHRLFDKYPNLERLGRMVAENLYLGVAKRLDSFLFLSPKERYEELFKQNSRLPEEIPQYMIASYLGVKPETLSRIRARK